MAFLILLKIVGRMLGPISTKAGFVCMNSSSILITCRDVLRTRIIKIVWAQLRILDFPTIYFKVADSCILPQSAFEYLGYWNLSARDTALSTRTLN